MRRAPPRAALAAWLDVAARSGDPVAAAGAAAEALAGDPWAVVTHAGRLARGGMGRALRDRMLPTAEGEKLTVSAGAPIPMADAEKVQRGGAFDTPPDLARRVVALARAAATRPLRRAADPTCGAGAFLVALEEAGLAEISGVELDPAAAAVARVAAPRARVEVGDCLDVTERVDLMVGNPPFVAPRRQSLALRGRLRARLPWIEGRCDLALAVAALAAERVEDGGGLGLVVPASLLFEPYGRPLRARWLQAHAVTALEGPQGFPGATVKVWALSLGIGAGPASLPGGMPAAEALALPDHPFDPALRAGDGAILGQIEGRSGPLGALCRIDTGVVSHGALGGKGRLLCESAGVDTVPYVDAADLVAGRQRHLRYVPGEMHRPKSPGLFLPPKVLVQRIHGGGPVRCWADHSGLFAGHTLTVVQPQAGALSVEAVVELLQDPLTAGILRLRRGQRLDLYPHDLAALPVPDGWAGGASLGVAWGLTEAQQDRLRALGARVPIRGVCR